MSYARRCQGVRLHLELLSKTHHIDVAPLIARLDQMMDSVSQLLQLARVGQSFSSGNYQEVKLLEDVILPSYDELNTMLETRQQTLLLPESAADVVVRGGRDVTAYVAAKSGGKRASL
nr:two-component sensor kinase [Salmonella sp. NCTC 7297]